MWLRFEVFKMVWEHLRSDYSQFEKVWFYSKTEGMLQEYFTIEYDFFFYLAKTFENIQEDLRWFPEHEKKGLEKIWRDLEV